MNEQQPVSAPVAEPVTASQAQPVPASAGTVPATPVNAGTVPANTAQPGTVPASPATVSASAAQPVTVPEPDYRAMYENLRRENEILRQNAEATQRAPVQGVSGGGAVAAPVDDFIRGFDSDTWD